MVDIASLFSRAKRFHGDNIIRMHETRDMPPAPDTEKEVGLPWLYHLYRFLEPFLAPFFLTGLMLSRFPKRAYRKIILGRLGLLEQGAFTVRKGDGPVFWVHALSYGEARAALLLIKGLRRRWHDATIVASSSTPTGLSELKKGAGDLCEGIIPFPYDLTFCVRRAIGLVDPDCFILVESDVWPNFLWTLRCMGKRCVLVNGSISEKAARRLSRVPGIAQFLYMPFARIGMQSETDKKRLIGLGIRKEKVLAPGNLKADAGHFCHSSSEAKGFLRELGLQCHEGSIKIVCGSTHPGEEEAIIKAFVGLKRRFPAKAIFLILAPRHPERGANIKQLAQREGLSVVRRTELFKGSTREDVDRSGPECIVVDTLGELNRFYAISDIAILGGTLVPVGGHNVLEPASFGLPVLVGPYVESIQDHVEELDNRRGIIRLKGKEGLLDALSRLLAHPEEASAIGAIALHYCVGKKGVLEQYIRFIEEVMGER